MEVKLTDWELEIAYTIGVKRHLDSLKKNLQNKFGATNERSLFLHVSGAVGEMAVAKALNKYYVGHVNIFTKPDVDKYQIRFTGMVPPQLIIRNQDKNDEIFISVSSGEQYNIFHINGWLYGKEGKLPEYIKNPSNRGEAYFIEINKLHSMEMLP